MNSPAPNSSFHWECSHLKVLASFRGLSSNSQSCWGLRSQSPCVCETLQVDLVGAPSAPPWMTLTFCFLIPSSFLACGECYFFLYFIVSAAMHFTGYLLYFICIWKHSLVGGFSGCLCHLTARNKIINIVSYMSAWNSCLVMSFKLERNIWSIKYKA